MQNTPTHSSRLKIRSEETAIGGRGNAVPHTSSNLSDTSTTKRRRKKKQSSKHEVYTGESHTLFSILKGIGIIGLLSLGLYYGAQLPFIIPYEKVTEFFTPKTTTTTAKVDPDDTASADKLVSSEQPAPVAEPESTGDESTDNQIPETEPEPAPEPEPKPEPEPEPEPEPAPEPEPTLVPEPDNPESDGIETAAEDSVSGDDEIRIAKIDAGESGSGDVNNVPETPDTASSTTETTSTSQQPVQTTTERPATPVTGPSPVTTTEESIGITEYTVSAYRATMFSDLSAADATETRVDHGAKVKVLERSGDWLKIEVEESGETGYMHIIHLSEG